MIKVKKVKLTKGRTLEIGYTEYRQVSSGDATNDVTKKCDWLAHKDLLEIIKSLTPHLIALCEMDGREDDFSITGFSIGGDNDDGEGVTLIGQRKLSTGKILNLVAPFTEFFGEEYSSASELYQIMEQVLAEVEEYLGGKSAMKQVEIPFDVEDEGVSINVETSTPKRKRKVKVKDTEPAEA